jgi:lipopolysaccharide export system permease protein
LSVLLTLTRAYRENEMVVWFSCGMGLTRWVRPVMYYALPIVCLIGLLSLVLSPWAMSKVDELKRRLDNRDDLTIASPGTFRESRQSDRVFFIESVDTKKNQIGNIFIQTMQNGRLGTLVAKHGVQEVAPNGDRFLVLLNGTRYDGTPGRLDFKIIEFERYSLRIKEAEARQRPTPLDSLSTPQLLKNSGSWNVSELERRLSLPLGALILSILAIPLSFVNPRTGRSFNLIMALAIYMVYNNLMGVITALVGQSKIDPIVAFLGIHMLMAALIAALFYYRLSVFSLWRLKR